MEILGTGIDIIEVKRIERAIARFGERFLRTVFTPAEVEYCCCKARPAQHYAARFAAKEAVIKAIGEGPRLPLNQVEIVRTPSGRPQVRILSHAHDDGCSFQISMSHTHEHATAVALRLGA